MTAAPALQTSKTAPRLHGGVRLVDKPSPDNIRRLDLNIFPMVQRMESNGILVNKDGLRKLSQSLGRKLEELTDKVEQQSGYRINVGSPDQIEALLFKKMALPVPPHFKLTKSGKRYVVDDEALSSIKSLHPVVETIQEYTENHKIKSSYADTLPIIASKEDGRVRTTLRTTRQVGGRISSSDPNLMAIPTRSEVGKLVRYEFIPAPGKKLGTMDQSQIEMRVAAHDSGCTAMIDTFLRGGDVHIETAARIFFAQHFNDIISVKGGKKAILKYAAEKYGMDEMKHRYPAKRIGFGVLFGITGQGLQDQIFVADDPKWSDADRQAFRDEWPVERCDATVQMWFDVYHEIFDSIKREHNKARRFGLVWDWFGRIRRIPEVRSCHKRIIEAGLRQAYSLRISSSAQGTMKLTMAAIWDKLLMDRYRGVVEPLLQIHDELIFEGEPNALEDFMADAAYEARNCIRLDVPVEVGTGTGASWGDLDK